jgi:hypothetical protein
MKCGGPASAAVAALFFQCLEKSLKKFPTRHSGEMLGKSSFSAMLDTPKRFASMCRSTFHPERFLKQQ